MAAGEKIIIDFEENNPKVVVTDGYHFTKPLEIIFTQIHTYQFHITCAIENMQLLAGCFLFIFLYLAGFGSGIFILKLLSFSPIAYILFLYYINRKDFIQLNVS